jgi:hypothetical protein
MPGKMNLNGVEVLFDVHSSAEDPLSHVSRKNVVPVVYEDETRPGGVSVFVDFSPPYGNKNVGQVVILNHDTGKVVENKSLSLGCLDEVYRGSTQIVQIPRIMETNSRSSRGTNFLWRDVLPSLWATVVHKRVEGKPLRYDLRLLILTGSTEVAVLNGNNIQVEVPSTCLLNSVLEEHHHAKKHGFIFPVGLTLANVSVDSDQYNVDFIMSSGVANKMSSFQEFRVQFNLNK